MTNYTRIITAPSSSTRRALAASRGIISPRAQDTPTPSFPSFELPCPGQEGRARAGIFHTPHGDLLTPVFAPVGTQATVKAITPAQLDELGASLVLSNTYHLYLRPGDELVAEMGGLHHFMNWPHPMLTDSGGYQVFSLSDSRKIDDDGVTFKSHIDGSTAPLHPRKIHRHPGKPGRRYHHGFRRVRPTLRPRTTTSAPWQRTHAWAERCLEAKTRPDQALFGIVQGGVFPDLRQAVGRVHRLTGFSRPCHRRAFGRRDQSRDARHAGGGGRDPARGQTALPDGRGTPEDLVNGVLRGVDIFDCVCPPAWRATTPP